MSNNKNNSSDNGRDNNIVINLGKSNLAEFTRRPVPTDREVERFEEHLEEEMRDEEIDESLSEIYQDKNGDIVDVSKLEIRKGRGILFWLFAPVFVMGILGGAGYGAYYYYLESGSDATAVEFSVTGEDKVTAGEEFFYSINYSNQTAIPLQNVVIEVKYPDNYVLSDSLPVPKEKNSIWRFEILPVDFEGEIKLKGKMIGLPDTTGILLASMSYTPANFSSEFRKEKSFATTLGSTGLDITFDYIGSVLVGEDNELIMRYGGGENNYINNFRLTVEPLENMEIASMETKEGDGDGIEYLRPGVWQINEVGEETAELVINITFTEKLSEDEKVILYCEQADKDGVFHKFHEQVLEFEVLKNDMNLTLIINGSRNDQGVNFGDTLNYSIVYTNKGETQMKDVLIMAVLDGGLLDWTTLSDSLGGRERGNTISWTKNEFPELEVIEENEEGTIDFSLKVSEPGTINPDRDYSIRSYAQFNIGGREDEDGERVEIKEDEDTRSNVIVNKINSDLKLREEVRYFNEDNIAVGTGPLPPRVGEVTSFKVYWSLTNNLHELTNTKVEVNLPEYVTWDSKNRASVGTVEYDASNHRVAWNIGRLPISVFRTDAEFNISVTPEEADRNKIMVLMPGSRVNAIDSETNEEVSDTTRAKTSKLEDDDIANNDGIVQ